MISEGPRETALNKLLAYAEGYAEFSMRKLGRVPPSLLAISPKGSFHFIPANLKDVRAKDSFANTARLICLAYGVTATVIVLEACLRVPRGIPTTDQLELQIASSAWPGKVPSDRSATSRRYAKNTRAFRGGHFDCCPWPCCRARRQPRRS